jgi:hypothetical protein
MKKTKKIVGVVGIFLSVIVILITLVWQFAHPELTSTQLLIKFWPVYVSTVILLAVSFPLIED